MLESVDQVSAEPVKSLPSVVDAKSAKTIQEELVRCKSNNTLNVSKATANSTKF